MQTPKDAAHDLFGHFGGGTVNTVNEEALQKAREELEKRHTELVELFGSDYENNPRFEEAARAVARGRAAWLVLADYSDHTFTNPTPPVDGTGWAW